MKQIMFLLEYWRTGISISVSTNIYSFKLFITLFILDKLMYVYSSSLILFPFFCFKNLWNYFCRFTARIPIFQCFLFISNYLLIHTYLWYFPVWYSKVWSSAQIALFPLKVVTYKSMFLKVWPPWAPASSVGQLQVTPAPLTLKVLFPTLTSGPQLS